MPVGALPGDCRHARTRSRHQPRSRPGPGPVRCIGEDDRSAPGSYTVNDSSKVVCGNVPTANATVYIVDTVLMPQ